MIHVRGIASWPKLNEPDTKFSADGEFKTKLILDAEVGERLNREFNELRAARIAEVTEQEGGKEPNVNDHPLYPELDDEEKPTGKWVLNCKMKASGKSKKTGKPWSRKLPLFDSVGNPCNVRVGAGSDIICAIDPITYAQVGKEKGKRVITVGVSLRLEAVQVIRAAGNSKDPASFGFGAVEGGFQAAMDAAAADRDEDDGDDEGNSGDYDF